MENVVKASDRVDVVRCRECIWSREINDVLIECTNPGYGPDLLLPHGWYCAAGKKGEEYCDRD